jgi:formylglycine-generating enzyme required for sulfatase activity
MECLLMVLFLFLAGCAAEPSQDSVQTAIAQTSAPQATIQQGISSTPINTQIPEPTRPSTKSLAMTPTAAPSLAVIPPKLGVGSKLVSDVDGMVMVYVPEGAFQRFVWSGGHDAGGDDIYLNGFWIDQTEVTNAMFAEFLNAKGNQAEGGATWLDAEDADVQIEIVSGEWQAVSKPEHPVVEVTWYGARAYCEWAGRRLPTITEWEKASRGEGGNLYPWGNAELNCNLANYKVLGNKSECRGETSKVGSYPDGASPYEALDTAGNVWEWVADWWWDPNYYESSPMENPLGPSSVSLRMLQGGSWIWLPSRLLVWNNRTSIPADSYYDGGFRCARSSS